MRRRPHQEYHRTRNVIRASPLTEFWTSHLYSLYNVYIRIEKLHIYQQYLRTNTQHYRNYGGLSQCPIAMLKMALPPYLQSWNMASHLYATGPFLFCISTEKLRNNGRSNVAGRIPTYRHRPQVSHGWVGHMHCKWMPRIMQSIQMGVAAIGAHQPKTID